MYLDEIATYWNARAEGYSQTIHEQLQTNVGVCFQRKLISCAPKKENLSCLDIGCGPGFFSILLAREGFEVTAVDYSEGMLEQARENFREMGVKVKTQQADAQELPFSDESFDYIVSRNLVWNLENPEKAYREWIRLLKPGGRLFIADGNHYLHYFDEDYLRAKEEIPEDEKHHCRGVDPTPINEIAKELPLSREHRPGWDIRILLEQGMEHIEVEPLRRLYSAELWKKGRSLVHDFILCAEKPETPVEEFLNEQREVNDHWTDASDNYSRIVIDELQSFKAEAWTKKIIDNAPIKPVLDVLDAGCGPGFFSILLSKTGHRTVGIDGSTGMLKHAKQNAERYGVSPLFIEGDCHMLPFSDCSFDLIVSRNVTHTLLNHHRAYCEWFRVLRPGGKLLIFDANWHLMYSDPKLREEFARREDECFRIYGSNFSGGRPEASEYENPKPHRLGNAVRPAWDAGILHQAGFEKIEFEIDITNGLWDDKEKLLYGLTPMFMISAEKPEETANVK